MRRQWYHPWNWHNEFLDTQGFRKGKRNNSFFLERCLIFWWQGLTFASQFGIDLWCNGNTPVFGSGFLGSNPGRSTEQQVKAFCSNAGGFFICFPIGVSILCLSPIF